MAMILYIAALTLSVCGYVHTIPAPLLDKFTFDDIFDSSFRVRGFSPNWLPGTNDFLYRERESGAVLRYHAPTDERTVYLDNSTFTQLSTGTYFVSPDLQYVLFATDIYSQWRHSFYAQYKILNVDTKELTSFPSGDLSGFTLQYAGWSSTGNSLSFVYENNLYYQASPSSDYVQLTTDGDPTYIFNGVPDWLYEEDVISDRVSHYWSPDGKYICYARLDDNGVPLQAWPWYGSKSNVFGDTIEIAYPKAGDVRSGAAGPNTKVEMYVVDVTIGSSSTKRAPPPTKLATVDHYYLQVAWRDSNNVYITWANRVQNKSISAIYDVTQPTLTPVENLNYEVSGGWVEVPPPEPWFIDDGASYLTVHPHTENIESGPWRQLALVTSPLTGPGAVTFLTTGEQEVDYVVGYDENLKLVYYISTMGDPAERHIARVGTPDSDPQYQTPTCLTCNYPDECRYITSSFSSTGLYYFVNCRGPEIPTYTLKSLVPGEESKNVVMENNDDLRANLARIAMPTRQFFTFNIIGTEFTARGEIFLPPDYVPGEQLPLLVYAYAGPGSQRVMKTFPMGGSTSNWLLHLKSYYRVIVASIDGRGSMANGDKLKFQMYRNLGTVEVEDQILGGINLRFRPEVDSTKRSAIFGWSYGGGTAAHIMGNESQAFTCGISVAPVTTKMYYDTAYTERYLGLATPDDDEAGYNKTDVMNKVANFQNKKFLLAHGIADDNVHFMHTTQLIRALENADILFRQHIYPDQNHGISSPGQSRHLYHSMTDFLLNDCWDGTLQVGNTSSSPRTEQNLSVTFGFLIIIFTTGQL